MHPHFSKRHFGRVTLTCAWCHREFPVFYYLEGRNRHCSMACRNAARRDANACLWMRATRESNGCWLWTGTRMAGGHGRLSYKGKRSLAHRLAWELTHGPIPAGMCVLHNCPGGDNPSCINPDHLWLGTDQQNRLDAVRKGQYAAGAAHYSHGHPEWRVRGAKHGSAKLTEADVQAMRTLYAAGGTTYRTLAAQFGLSSHSVQQVIRRMTWKHVP